MRPRSTPASEKGELFGLRKSDIDFDAALIIVRRSYDRDRTKGAHEEGIPIADELAPYLKHAIGSSPSHLVFPKTDGTMMSEDTKLEGVLRRALGRAGIVTGFEHVCRKKGCGYREATTNAAPRRCPKDKMKLWVKPQVRPIRFHDLRHTTGSLLFQTGANPAAVQRILRHSDPRITTEVYGHLAPDYLKAEVDRLRFGAASLPSQLPQSAPPSTEPAAAVAAGGDRTVTRSEATAEPFAAYVLQDAQTAPPTPTNTAADQQHFQSVAAARHRGFEPLTFGSGGASISPSVPVLEPCRCQSVASSDFLMAGKPDWNPGRPGVSRAILSSAVSVILA